MIVSILLKQSCEFRKTKITEAQSKFCIEQVQIFFLKKTITLLVDSPYIACVTMALSWMLSKLMKKYIWELKTLGQDF